KSARVLDMAAAPGGKTMQLAAADAHVTALDISGTRLARLRDNLARTGLDADIVETDARRYQPDEVFDGILLDAPCSATGIFRRHPDVLHLRAPNRMTETLALQAALLDHAATLTKPGGTLVYAVCSLEPLEGEDQLEAFLARTPGWHVDPPPPGALPDELIPKDDGTVRTLPGQFADRGGLDGFFMTRLTKG
ncbi:MAG: RsmB/NOP family class I SAM-dependent RNA methyltransferase, partial [Pseudomonadota bacterium]